MRTAILWFLLATSAQAATTYRVEPVNGTISFSITKWGVVHEEGTFRQFTGTIVMDKAAPAQSQVTFVVDTASVDTKNGARDSTLRSPDFFHAARFPQLTFRSTRVEPRQGGLANVTGDLTIRGVTRRVTVPVRLTGMRKQPGVGEIAAFETSFVIDRRQFGVTGGRWTAGAPGVLGNDVRIRIVAGAIAR